MCPWTKPALFFFHVLQEKEHNSLTLLPLSSLNKAVTSSFMGILNAMWHLRQVKVTWAEITTHALWAQYLKILMCNFTERHSPNKAKQAEFDPHFLFSTFMSQQSSFYMCKSSLFGPLLDWTSWSQQWGCRKPKLSCHLESACFFLRSIWPQETLPGGKLPVHQCKSKVPSWFLFPWVQVTRAALSGRKIQTPLPQLPPPGRQLDLLPHTASKDRQKPPTTHSSHQHTTKHL